MIRNLDHIVEQIKAKIEIVPFIQQYVNLTKKGRHYTGLCPFHSETTPSFVVTPEREMWYCFGACKEGGDVIAFLMKWENITFYEALKELGDQAGVSVSADDVEDGEWTKKDSIFRINQMALQYYQHLLQNTSYGEKARQYLQSRGLNDRIIQTFELGYAPASWDSLVKFLVKKGFEPAQIVDTGLGVQSSRGSVYDRLRGRIIFPIRDARDHVVGFSGRLIDEGDHEQPKYLNISETAVYHKRESLYGIHITKEAIRAHKTVVIVEGEFDVIIPYEHGIDNVVAIKGSSVTTEHLKILQRYAQKIILCLDADAAGNNAVIKAIHAAEIFDLELQVIQLPDGMDPADAAQESLGVFKSLLKKPTPAYEFVIEAVASRYPDRSPFDQKKIVHELASFLQGTKNIIVREYYLKKLSERIEMPVEVIKLELEDHARQDQKKQVRRVAHETRQEDPAVRDQKYMLSFIIQNEDPGAIYRSITKILEPEDFSVLAMRKIYEQLGDYLDAHQTYSEDAFAASLANELRPMFDEVAYTLLDPIKLGDQPVALARTIKLRLLQRFRQDALQIADPEKREAALARYSQERVRVQGITT